MVTCNEFGGSLPSAMSIREAAFCGKTYQYARTGMHIYEGPMFIIMDALCTTAVSYSTMITCIRYVLLRSAVFTRILRGGTVSKYHTWNDITPTPTRRTRLARRDNQLFIVMSPLLSTHKGIARRR